MNCVCLFRKPSCGFPASEGNVLQRVGIEVKPDLPVFAEDGIDGLFKNPFVRGKVPVPFEAYADYADMFSRDLSCSRPDRHPCSGGPDFFQGAVEFMGLFHKMIFIAGTQYGFHHARERGITECLAFFETFFGGLMQHQAAVNRMVGLLGLYDEKPVLFAPCASAP